MSVLFCTPMYGAMCWEPYFKSALILKEELTLAGFKHDFLTTTNESLVTRARNTSAATFLKTDYDSLMFIDGDIEFHVEHIHKLWQMNTDVAVAAYPWKKKEQKNVTAWKDGQLVETEKMDGVTEVDYAGTGFMMIKRGVFERMKEAYPFFKHTEGNIGDCWAFFDTAVEDGIYLSEDYFFCKRWRELGGKIMLDPSINLVHWGSFGYGSQT